MGKQKQKYLRFISKYVLRKPVNTWLDLVDDVYYSTIDQIYSAAIVFFLQFLLSSGNLLLNN